ncbi:hypothetical protein A2U01_0118663, partial [Trifolium medium]|nr:hypothetical protein [Trifolium medium]
MENCSYIFQGMNLPYRSILTSK